MRVTAMIRPHVAFQGWFLHSNAFSWNCPSFSNTLQLHVSNSRKLYRHQYLKGRCGQRLQYTKHVVFSRESNTNTTHLLLLIFLFTLTYQLLFLLYFCNARNPSQNTYGDFRKRDFFGSISKIGPLVFQFQITTNRWRWMSIALHVFFVFSVVSKYFFVNKYTLH